MRKVLNAYDVVDSDIEKSIQDYRNYLIKHIENVQKGYRILILPLVRKDINSNYFTKDDLMKAISNLDKHIYLHDTSKWSKEEFDAYRYKFYPTKYEKSDPNYSENVKRVFGLGWKHHHENNEHHLNYWCEDGIKRDMPLDFILEMICDWYSMSVYFKSSILEWYEKDAKKEKAMMTEKTRNIVDDLLYNVLRDKMF